MSAPAAEVLRGWADRFAGEDTPDFFPLSSTSSKLEALRTVKAGAGTLFGFSGLSTNVAAQFIQVHDTTDALQTGHVPVIVITVPASSNFSYDAGFFGRAFRGGIIIANSTTAATFTAGASDCWFDAQYA